MKAAKIIALFILLWCGGQVYSQNKSFVPELSYGLNGGATFSKVGFNSYFLRVPQVLYQQFSSGITVRYISESHFGIQVELNYSQRGWKERTDTINLNKYSRSIAYLELPVMTHIYFNLAKPVRLFFNLGPQINFYLGEKETERDIVDDKLNTNLRETTSYYDISVQHSFDYGLKGALGLEFRTKAGSFILDGRYYYGLSDVFNTTRSDWFQSSHNQVIGVNLSYLFR